jgi:mono/diheme cytochrome c family protein
MDGTYTATLVVNDGADDSAPDSVTVTATTPGGGGSFAAGQADYDTRCAGCHDAGTHDSSGGFAGDIAGTGSLLVNDLGTLSGGMNGIILTNQEILDLQAFLDDPSIQP